MRRRRRVASGALKCSTKSRRPGRLKARSIRSSAQVVVKTKTTPSLTWLLPPSGVFATALTPPSIACAVVTNLPSAEIKKPLSVRNKFPFESNTVTQITAGLTLLSRFAKSDDEVRPASAPGEALVEGKGVGD